MLGRKVHTKCDLDREINRCCYYINKREKKAKHEDYVFAK